MEMTRKKSNFSLRLVFFVLLIVLTVGMGSRALAASAKKTDAASAGTNQGWVKKNGSYYYYNKKGKAVKGLKPINGKTYYFDQAGRQRTGWRQVGKKVYYFQIENGKRGYRLSAQTVNGVKIKKSGEAKVTGAAKDRVDLLLRYQKLADELEAYPLESKQSKLVRAFKYARDTHYREVSVPTSGKWDQVAARRFLESRYAECIISACGFAYLANAIGYKNITVRQYVHGHCEINRRIYDPGFAKTVSDGNYGVYFNRSYSDLPSWGTGSYINTRKI